MIGSGEPGRPIAAEAFASAMASLGPFEAAPRIAAGVSGGADSMALALLANAWAGERDGVLLALVVDHGLRAESGIEAAETATRLAGRGITARVLAIDGLARGSALAERARRARFDAMIAACSREGMLHLLLGHHAGDQAETVLIRSLSGSGFAGLAGMAALTETPSLRILRPLLSMPPEQLRAVLVTAGEAWVEDPSNADTTALRPRLRLLRRDRDGGASATAALTAAAGASGRRRAEDDNAVAAELAERASLRPEGFCVLCEGVAGLAPRSLAALVQAVAGARFPPPAASVASLAAKLRPATLAGVRLLPAGRLGPGLLIVREAAAMAPSIPARPGAIWDGRFRIGAHAQVPPGATLGALGADAARLRRRSPLPAAVLQTLPALRSGARLLTVPHLLYPDDNACACILVTFAPPRPVAAAPFPVSNAFGDA